MATLGYVFGTETFRTIKATYHRTALDIVEEYYHDAVMNDLAFDRHAEERAVELFGKSIMDAGERMQENPMETPFIPSWNRAVSAFPEAFDEIRKAVEADNS